MEDILISDERPETWVEGQGSHVIAWSAMRRAWRNAFRRGTLAEVRQQLIEYHPAGSTSAAAGSASAATGKKTIPEWKRWLDGQVEALVAAHQMSPGSTVPPEVKLSGDSTPRTRGEGPYARTLDQQAARVESGEVEISKVVEAALGMVDIPEALASREGAHVDDGGLRKKWLRVLDDAWPGLLDVKGCRDELCTAFDKAKNPMKPSNEYEAAVLRGREAAARGHGGMELRSHDKKRRGSGSGESSGNETAEGPSRKRKKEKGKEKEKETGID